MPEPATIETPPVTPATPPAVPAPPIVPQQDAFLARVLGDMGIAVKDGKLESALPPAPEPVVKDRTGDFTSMGEHARYKKEREEAKALETPPAKTPEPPAADPKTADTTPPATVPPAKPKVAVEKARPIEEIVEGVVRRVTQEQKPTEATPKIEPPKVEDPDADFLEGLDEDQREIVDLAKFAAKAMPEKYGNLVKKTTEYLKQVEGKIAEKIKEDPDWNAGSDEDFKEWLQERRPITDHERRRLEREQIKSEVRADVEKEFKPKLEESERRSRVQEVKPEVDKAVDSFKATVAQRFIPDDKSPFFHVFKAASEKDPTFAEEAWQAARAIDPLAASVAKNFMDQSVTLGKEYLELVSGVSQQVEFNPKLAVTASQNQKALMQQRLFGFIESQEQIFAKDGGDMRVVNGKAFATRHQLAAMTPAEQARHWTLGHEDVLDMLAVAASSQANAALQSELKRREDEGFVKNGNQQPPKKEEAPPVKEAKKEESPRATTTPSPGSANLPPPQRGPTVFSQEELEKQWKGGNRSWPG